MKIKVEYSESLQISEGMWRKIGVEVEDEQPGLPSMSDADFAYKTYKTAKEYVQNWHKETQPMTSKSWLEPIVNGSLPVIDRSIERLEILIDDCKTIEELHQVYFKNDVKIQTSDSLKDTYYKKQRSLEELSK